MRQSGLKTFLLLLCALFSTAFCAIAQNASPAEKLQKDYPLLTARYGNQLDGEKAHYIFVIDVSSSMLAYEKVEKENLLKFIDAVPDGDQVTIIRMADEDYTDYVNMFKCITLDPGVRASLRQSINGQVFQFLNNSDKRNGSDGFHTASLVVDAINTVGSNELTFIYLFTDFEYWTHKFHYDKTKENWKSLIGRVPDTYLSGMCKFGIELGTGAKLHQEGVFKSEMDAIFGKVSYLPVTSASVLSQWFGHIISDVMATKLYASLKKEWKEVTDSVDIDSRVSGDQLTSRVSLPKDEGSPLVKTMDFTVQSAMPQLQPMTAEGIQPGEKGVVGHINMQKGFLPGYATINSDNATLQVTYHSDYEDEIARLKQVCKVNESDSSDVNLTRNYPLGGLSYSAWQSFIPLWAWIVLAVILIVVLCSVLYTAFVMKTDHAWIVRVKEDGLSVKHPLGDLKEQFSVGLKGDYQVPTANWTMTIKGKKYNPLLFWHKSGYYISWDKGVITVENKTLATKIGVDPGTDTFIWPLKSGGNFVINKGSFKITLSV